MSFATAALLVALAAAPRARADTLQVGAGAKYATPCAAVAAAQTDDVIEIDAGTYTDSCVIGVAGLTLRGQNGQPKIDLSGTDHPANYKGIYVIAAERVTIENLELTGAHISDANGANAAALRVEAPGLTVRRCNIHDNQNGILGGTTGTITIEYSEFAGNARGDGCNGGGCTHNLYIAAIDTLNFRFNWSHRVATDTADKGHLLKSRAKNNFILYNRLTGEDGFDSYEVDLPNGGLAVLIGNQIQKGPKAGNSTLFSWGEEGASNPDKRVFLAFNTFVNDFGSGRFLNVGGATLLAHDNIFAGAGSVGAANPLSSDNWAGATPGFVDAARYDYHLTSDSPVIGKAVEAGKADGLSLTPDAQYMHPLARIDRASARDLGALESGSSEKRPAPAGSGGAGAAGMAQAGGTGHADAGHAAGAGSGGEPDAGEAEGVAGGSGRDEPAAADGCGCRLTRVTNSRQRFSWFAVAAAICACARRRRRGSSRSAS